MPCGEGSDVGCNKIPAERGNDEVDAVDTMAPTLPECAASDNSVPKKAGRVAGPCSKGLLRAERMGRAAVVTLLLGALLAGACQRKTAVEMYVDGFQPRNVRFEVEDLGPLDQDGLAELDRRPDVDGLLTLPPGSCGGAPCRVSLVSVFLDNTGADGTDEPAPVVRLKSPPSRALRLPIAYRGGAIDRGRIGRIRWAVELWPEETSLTATLSSSVQIVDAPAPVSPPPVPPAPAPVEKGLTP